MPVIPSLVSENFESLSFLKNDIIIQQALKSRNSDVVQLIRRNAYAVAWAGDYLLNHFFENWESSQIEKEINRSPAVREFIGACRFPDFFVEQAIHYECWDLAELLILVMMRRGLTVDGLLRLIAEDESSAYTNIGLRARYATKAAPARRALR